MECIYVPKDKQLTLKIAEEIDENSTDKLRRKIDNEITRFLPRKVIFDFSNVSFMDSAGIGMLLGRYKVIRMLGGNLAICNVNNQIKKVFEISGILKIIPIINDDDLSEQQGINDEELIRKQAKAKRNIEQQLGISNEIGRKNKLNINNKNIDAQQKFDNEDKAI